MPFTPRALGFWLSMLVLTAPAFAQEKDPNGAEQLWASFAHYTLVARPDLAAEAGQKLIDSASDAQLLTAVEGSDYAQDTHRLFRRAAGSEALKPVAEALEEKLRQARLELSRDANRLANDVTKLGESQRAYMNAVERLRRAGQFAAPPLLAALRDRNQTTLHPYILRAMAAVGQPLVYPLSVALPELEPVVQTEVTRVLAQIGYPEALPYLKLTIENPNTDPSVRAAAVIAFDRIAATSRLTGELSAAQLFVALGEKQYTEATASPAIDGYDTQTETGILWSFRPGSGLFPTNVPTPIYGDVRAMRSAEQALQLRSDFDQALSLYLMANLRRENRLPAGVTDPSYRTSLQPAGYYARLAGPLRLHDILGRSLADRDADLALDAIAALADTAATNALISQGAAQKPLLEALSFPDRRVRFAAATTLAAARPSEPFERSFRVVPVLAEMIRQSSSKVALVLADDQDTLNRLLGLAQQAGFEAFGGLALYDVAEEIVARPGIDLLILDKTPDTVIDLIATTATDYKLSAIPILALATPSNKLRLERYFLEEPRLHITTARPLATGNTESGEGAVTEAIAAAATSFQGHQVSEETAEAYALQSLRLMRDIALEGGIYQVTDAQPTLEKAVTDPRPRVALAAGSVLELLGGESAQQALATAALTARGEHQIQLLGFLSNSARYFGNQLTERQAQALATLAASQDAAVALAATQVHGSLQLPTSYAVQMLFQNPR